MKTNLLNVCAIALGLVVLSGSNHVPVNSSQEKTDSELESRVLKLERRVQALEQILFSTAQLSSDEAQRQLDNAIEQLKQSKRLHVKGFVTDIRLRQDQFRVEQAKKTVELANAEAGQRQLACEIDAMDAERRLQDAEQNLRHSKLLSSRGYVSQQQVDQDARSVDIARQAVETAKIKLEAVKKLDAIDSK